MQIRQHTFENMGTYVNHEVMGCFSDHALAVRVSHRDFSEIDSKEEKLKLILAQNKIKTENKKTEDYDRLMSIPVID